MEESEPSKKKDEKQYIKDEKRDKKRPIKNEEQNNNNGPIENEKFCSSNEPIKWGQIEKRKAITAIRFSHDG